jgi:hypothetical protein
VARDGIEPPTPAFSGPRSTTELSGLGMCHPALRGRQGRPYALFRLCTCLCQGSVPWLETSSANVLVSIATEWLGAKPARKNPEK